MKITREQAHWTARGYLRENQPEGCTEVVKVLSLDEITSCKPCVYNVSDAALAQAWIAYCHNPEVIMLKSSTIVVISKDTREVIYAGSAGDEG